MYKSIIWLVLGWFGYLPCGSAQVTPDVIRYPFNHQSSFYQHQDRYYSALLQLALENADSKLSLQPVSIPTMPQGRSVTLLKSGVYDVHWMVSNIQRESALLPIRIPLYKGLIGWRMLLINQSKQRAFTADMPLKKLQTLIAGQGVDWPDTDILKHNGFRVETSATTQSLQNMLSLNRVDYFPRSVIEIWQERDELATSNVDIQADLVLQYPMAVYFFVNKDNRDLHDILYQGLKIAVENGEFEQLFQQFFADVLQQADLPNKRIIKLENPQLSAATPLHNKSLWYHPN
ncbi:diguanylate cyclase [Neptunicella marina]|uniref:Diguanylate cyclase n=1 Tax=Neptunicella marina TaxID=2125989 RepID=A0A8J6IUV6_9ALTE|nr:diguanylate cyclase [Neptunicella marina]MBC3765913.1 diguanylate cyclase [Neptunicella marina]